MTAFAVLPGEDLAAPYRKRALRFAPWPFRIPAVVAGRRFDSPKTPASLSPTPDAEVVDHAPLFWLLAPSVLGLFVARLFAPTWSAWPFLIVGLGTISLAARIIFSSAPQWLSWRIAFLSGAGLLFVGHGLAHRLPPLPESPRPPAESTLSLRIERLFTPRGTRASGVATVMASSRSPELIEGRNVFFSIWTADADALLPGARLEARGRLAWLPKKPIDSFERYLRQTGVIARFEDAEILAMPDPGPFLERFGAVLRHRFDEGLRASADNARDAQIAELWRAMLTGRKGGLNPELREAFAAAGVLHLFAVSGLHIGLITATLILLGHGLRLTPLPRFLLTIALSGAFVWMIGAPPSALRAWLMVMTWELAHILYRRRCSLSALAGSALLILLIAPRQLFTIGFQMSYVVIAGILLYGVPLGRMATQRWAQRPGWTVAAARWLVQATSVTFSAILFGAPLAIFYFGQVSLIGLGTNLILIPASTLAVPLGMASGTAGLLGWLGLAADINALGYRLLEAMEWVALEASRAPGAALPLALPGPWWVASAVVGMLAFACLRGTALLGRQAWIWLPPFFFAAFLQTAFLLNS